MTQAHYLSSASHRVFLAPDVDMLIQYLLYDDAEQAGWQSGPFTQPGPSSRPTGRSVWP